MASTPASVSALLKPNASIGRNAFPLDHRQVFSIKAGQITPVKCLKFVPNDHFKIDVAEFCITFPMQTSPFLRGRKETVFYKVYNSAVWSLFNQYIATRNDPKTSALNSNLTEPRIALWDLYRGCLSQFVYYLFSEYYFLAKAHADYRDGVNYDDIARYNSEQFFNNTISYPITLNNFVPDSEIGFGVGFDFASFGFDNTSIFGYDAVYSPSGVITYNDVFKDVVGQWRVYNWIKKLDMLGYGNLYPYFKEVEDSISNYIETSDWNSSSAMDDFLSYANGAMSVLARRLCRITHTWDNPRTQDGMPSSTSNIYPKYQNLYAICAYNLIFYHFFRNSYYDLGYNSKDFNLDFVSSIYQEDNDFNKVSLNQFSLRFLDLEYHQWKKDQFTSVLPDTQFGAVSGLTINTDLNSPARVFGDKVANNNQSFNSVSQATDGHIFATRTSIGDSNFVVKSLDINASFDVIALKRAEILQDYRQTLMRSGNKTSDIFKALYGGAPSSEHLDDIIPQFLETFGEDVFVDPVTATANTGQGSQGTLGDLSARGKFSGGSQSFNVSCGHNFGVIMALTYFVPTAEYNSYFVDYQNSILNPEDHYISNFENMGLEPIYSDELNGLIPCNDVKVLGYAPRYHYLKSAVDVVHGAFCALPKNLTLSRSESSGTLVLGRTLGFNGAFNIWVSPRTDMQNRNATQLRDFYINPAILDNIFVQSVDATQDSDHILCNTYLNIQSTRGMSKIGLLNFA